MLLLGVAVVDVRCGCFCLYCLFCVVLLLFVVVGCAALRCNCKLVVVVVTAVEVGVEDGLPHC